MPVTKRRLADEYNAAQEPGNTLAVTAPAAVSSGDVVVVGALLGVAATDAAISTPVEVTTEGVFEVACATADDISPGDLLYFDSGGPELTSVAGTGSKPLVGMAVNAAGVGVVLVKVRLAMFGQIGPA